MNRKLKNTLIALAIPTAYGVLIRIIFGVQINRWDDLFQVMTVSFLFLVPTIMGALTVFLSSYEKAKKISYRVLAPWIPIVFLIAITLLLTIEGWACWLMILPVFLVTASIGGLFGGYLKMQQRHHQAKISIILILVPFVINPIETQLKLIPATYQVNTSIDIAAPKQVIWKNVTRVHTIPKQMDKGDLNRFLGFPRPVKAELNYDGRGATRKAIFTNGLVFHETVTHYEDNKKMVFDIKAYPYEIPSTTLDEHVVIGGDYFDVLNGTYELEPLANGKNRLHLYSHFKLHTTFNFYAGLWAKWIMKDIQNNILQVQKKRAEEESDMDVLN